MKFTKIHRFTDSLSLGWGLRGRFSVPQDEVWAFQLSTPGRFRAGIDMLGVFMSLGVVWLDKQERIVDFCLAQPFGFYWPGKKAYCVVEFHPKHLVGLKKGQRLRLVSSAHPR